MADLQDNRIGGGARASLLVLLALLVVCGTAPGAEEPGEGKVRVRFREHYDRADVDLGGRHQGYGGFSNTVNIWYERDLGWAAGLAMNPLLGDWRTRGGLSPELPASFNEVRLRSVGAEGVYYWLRDGARRGLFTRGGLYWSTLELDRARDRQGFSYLVSAGAEARVWQVGVIPEVAMRHSFLERGTFVVDFTPSLALKLYFLEPVLAAVMPGAR